MKLTELFALNGNIDYSAVDGAISRFGKRLEKGEMRAEAGKIEPDL